MSAISTETLALTGCAVLLVILALGMSPLNATGTTNCFQRGISFGFLADALLALLVATALNPALPDLAPLAVMLALTLLAGRRIYRRQPAPIL